MKFLARTALFLALVIGAHAIAYTLVPDTATGGLTTSLPACATEDSTDCVWAGDSQGNGLGQSFLDINGTAYYFGG